MEGGIDRWRNDAREGCSDMEGWVRFRIHGGRYGSTIHFLYHADQGVRLNFSPFQNVGTLLGDASLLNHLKKKEALMVIYPLITQTVN